MKKTLAILLFSAVLAVSAQDYNAQFRAIPQQMRQQKGDKFDKYDAAKKQIEAVKAPAPNADPKKAKAEAARFLEAKSSTYIDLLNQFAWDNPRFAYTEFQTLLKEGKILAKHKGRPLPGWSGSAIRNGDRELWEMLWKDFKVLTKEQRNIWSVPQFFSQFPNEQGLKLMNDYFKAVPDLSDGEKFNIYSGFVQGKLNNGQYEWAKAQMPKVEKMAASVKNANLNSYYNNLALKAFENSDIAFAREMATKTNNKTVLLKIALLDAGKDYAKCATLIKDAIKDVNPKEKGLINQMRSAVYLLENKGDLKNFDAAFKDDNFTPQQRLAFAREGCRYLWNVRKFEIIMKTDANIYSDWFIPFETKFYDVKYVDLAPASAGAWIQSKYYNDWSQMEQRFFRYDNQYQTAEGNDWHHLKGVEQKPLDNAYRTGVHFLADVHGLHIYIRGNDPAMDEVFTAKRDAGGMECYFKPGYNAPYSMWFCNELPKCVDTYEVDFAGPSSQYKFTIECVKRDAQITRDAVVVHALIPWEDFIHYLPFTGNMWYFGMQRWCKDSRTLSGHVHELERMVRLRFNFDKESKTAILRQICRKSYNTYANQRNDRNGKIMQWNQPDVGDPAFFEKALLPMLTELDEAGKNINEADLPMLEKLQAEFAPRWQNIMYEIDRVRIEYLKEQLMK